MKKHEAFNRSGFSRFINSSAGRVFRLVAGSGFLGLGYLVGSTPLGLVAMGYSVLPLTAGGFDVCWISAALGGPLSGSKVRACQRSPIAAGSVNG